MFKCFECEVLFKNNNNFRSHLEEKHEITNQMEELNFSSYNGNCHA